MAIKGLRKGTKSRHLFGPNLKELEDLLENIEGAQPYAAYRVGGNHYLLFTVPWNSFEKTKVVKEVSKKTKVTMPKT